MEVKLKAEEASTAGYLEYELINLGCSLPVTVLRDGNEIAAACSDDFGAYFLDELKSLLCRWFDYCGKAAYLRQRISNPGLNAAIYEAYVQSLTLMREDYHIQDRMPICAENDLEGLYTWYLKEIRPEWDKIVSAAARYPVCDDRMAVRFIRKLRREIHSHMSFVRLVVRDDGYFFTDSRGHRLDFLEPAPPYGMLTDSVWLNAARVEVRNLSNRRLPLVDLVRDVNPDMAISLVQALGE